MSGKRGPQGNALDKTQEARTRSQDKPKNTHIYPPPISH
jgi:hypothetical protein